MQEAITLPYRFKPRPYQLAFFEAMDYGGKKRAFCRWTRRAGKDVAFWNFLIKKAFERIGNYYYVFPNYTQGKKAIWEGKTKAQFQYLNYIPPGWEKSRNSNEMKLELHNGSIIRIVGSEDIDKLRGAGPCGIVISEFAYHSAGEDVLAALTPMLAENDGWLIINSTPAGKNFMYDFEQTIISDPDWFISEIQSLWPDLPNYYPVYTTAEIDDLYAEGKLTHDEFWQEAIKTTNARIESERKMGRTEEWIEQEYGVSYAAGQKGAFYADCIKKARDEGRIGSFIASDHRFVDVLFDLGRTDDTAIWFRQIEGNRVNWIDYYENNTKDLMHYVTVLKDKGYSYRTIVIPHDGKQSNIQTNMSTKDLLYRLLLESRLSTDILVAEKPASKQIPIMLTRERFSRYYFNEANCADGITKLSLYHRQYDKKLKVFKSEPAHDWCSHAADAIALDGVVGDQLDNAASRKDVKIITEFNPLEWE